MTIDEEFAKVMELTGALRDQIRLCEDGFWSRGYVIDDGRIVFKFRRKPEVSYLDEIKMLDFVNSMNLGINLQKVGWTAPDDTYLGVYGVVGKSIETHDYDIKNTGEQLGNFLKKLHSTCLETAEKLSLDAEIKAWQDRFYDARSWAAMSEWFARDEMEILDNYMRQTVPTRLLALGEKLVLSHGDLGDGNIFVDRDGKVGVIDFSETCYLDEAADFMDVTSAELCGRMLDAYGADEILREKVQLRRELRPLIVFGGYAKRNDRERLKGFVAQIRGTLLQ